MDAESFPIDEPSATTATQLPATKVENIESASGLTSIGKLTSSVGDFFKSLSTKRKLPMPNALNIFASYNYVISLTCLSAAMFNDPDSTYMVGKLPPLILNSANANPNDRIATISGRLDFYIESLSLTGLYGFDKALGNTNTTNLEFTVIEPYSMGMFMVACQQAAYESGYQNFNEAPYLLIIEFLGSDQNGILKTVPGTKK